MEVLQCDGCDFRAESYDDLKGHIQDVHTAFLQPTAVGEGTSSGSRSGSLNSLSHAEEDEDELGTLNSEHESAHEHPGLHSYDTDSGHYSGSNNTKYSQSANKPSKPTNQFFQCKFCIRYFRSRSLLIDHTRKVHGFVGDSSFSGRQSPASQISRQSNYSILMHETSGKVFSCQYCTYKSPRKARILKHQKMYHKGSLLDSPGSPIETGMESGSNAVSSEDSCSVMPEEVVERSVLDSMVKPLTKSRGNFSCEWCSYQTFRRERWCDHVMKKHRNMVKIISSLQQQEEGESAGSSKSDSPSSPGSTPNSTTQPHNSIGNEASTAIVENNTSGLTKKLSSYNYSKVKSKIANSTGSSVLSDRSTFVMSDRSNSDMDMDTNIVIKDSASSSDDDLEDVDEPSNTNTSKQLLSEEDTKMLETKGVQFRRYLNRFQCPFCSFLTMHRRSISRHIENIHLSGKTTLYKCEECSFVCTNLLKLGTHKQIHTGAPTDWDVIDLHDEGPRSQKEGCEPVNGGNISAKINGKKGLATNEVDLQNPHRCTLCNFSTTTLKGLRVHQQHKHSYCDNLHSSNIEGSLNDTLDSESETYSSSSYVQKTQTSILGYSARKSLIKTARKSINDAPLDLSPVKKRTRIDEIANNLQSKISQSKQLDDDVINLEEMVEEEGSYVEMDYDDDKGDAQGESHEGRSRQQRLYFKHSTVPKGSSIRKKTNNKSKCSLQSVPIQLSDDEDNEMGFGLSKSKDHQNQDSSISFQDNLDCGGGSEAMFYCKHCEYHNKSARSVSTHYQRMHPYIKFSFRYILDPEDQSAVFRCLECYIEYTNFDDLNQHYMDHHPEAINVLNFNQPNLLYRCRFCSYTSPNVRSLMPHYQRMHPTVKINNAMIFSSYVVEQPQKSVESKTLREILNSGTKGFATSSSRSNAQSSPIHRTLGRMQDSNTEPVNETLVNNVVVYDCDICTFASPNMHSVLVHYQKKHPEQKASYFRIQKTMRLVSVDKPAADLGLNVQNSPKPSAAPLETDDEIYYCKHCVYSNRSVVGVLVHYQKRHPEIKVTAKYIKHAPPSPSLMKLMDELQIAPPKQFLKQFNNGIDSSNSHAGVGGEKGEAEMLFFCQHCDYGNRTVKGVLIHYQKKHKDVKANADLVRRHTAVVRSQRERAQMIQSGNISTATSDSEKTGTLRSLKCRHCPYASPYVYALKKHLKKDHPTVKATAMTILRWAYQDGVLEAGYHCEWCIYSHAEPNGLLMHYQRRHPEHNVDYAYMASKLWAGPEMTSLQQAGNSDTKHYQCKDCAFEACSIWDITNHYQAVHPWAIKSDDSVLLDIIKGNSAADQEKGITGKGHVSVTSPFNSSLPRHEEEAFDLVGQSRDISHVSFASSSILNNPYQCTVCLSEYHSLHGLLTHYGKKHPGMKVKAADFAQEADINPNSVYKCRHCPYVNSRIHGVLTHYQKRHPLVKVTADDFADDVETMTSSNEGDEKYKSQRQGYGAYRCKMCPYTHGTLEKLKIHYEKYHNQPATDMFNHASVTFTTGKDDMMAESSSTSVAEVPEVSDFQLGLAQFPVDKEEKNAVFRCQLCKYFCSTRKGIARHYRIKHNNVRAQPEGKNNVFKCALCSYTNPIRKGLAAHYQKRHDIDAYYTHCLAASKTFSEKPHKVLLPVPSPNDGTSMNEELREAVETRKCSLCSFEAFSKKSIISHYIKRHPGVFPKRQHSSKLERYFTIVYTQEPEDTAEVKNGKTEGEPEVDQNGEQEWLPFKCLKCFKLSFNTSDLLCMHYTDYHTKDFKQDFNTSTSLTVEGTESYQCSHCDLKTSALQDLGVHLAKHNEDLQKRAMRQERRRQLQSKHKGGEPERPENHVGKTPVGYRCNFCVEVHPTLRAICNHLRKHVQYGEAKTGHVEQEGTEVALEIPKREAKEGDGHERTVAVQACPETADMPVKCEHPNKLNTDEMDSGPRAVNAVPIEALLVSKPKAGASHRCNQCDRVFMSMQGLRSHERSHSAMAMITREDKYSCQYCQFASPFRHNLYRHIQSHHGHHKPFRCKLCSFKSAYLSRLKSHLHKAHTGENTYRCSCCSFSTMTISQLKDHSLEVHGEALTLPKLRAATQTAFRPHKFAQIGDMDLSAPKTDDHVYLEPPDQYQLAPQLSQSPPSRGDSPEVEPRLDGTLTCEFCDFSSGYMQSLRRHYRDRHGGRKLFKCKECTFFTCNKTTLTLHMEAGHVGHTGHVPEETPKELRCPLCFYHTQHKTHMIDHILLHREEGMAAADVSQSKLLRCHCCAFSCSSEESLQLHVQKHDGPKPYYCQLCYYDCRQPEELEAHLRGEHKVIRNFEMVGRVNLDQMEATNDKSDAVRCAEDEVEEMNEEEPENKVGPGSPGSDMSSSSGKRFPCEFCGRTFAVSGEWERHVLRHGMTVCPDRKEGSPSHTAGGVAKAEVQEDSDGEFAENDTEAESECPLDLVKNVKVEEGEAPQTP